MFHIESLNLEPTMIDLLWSYFFGRYGTEDFPRGGGLVA
jgi:hypothetical protein